jgi:hypothetical protein
MRVGLLSNTHLKCGAGAYGRDLYAAFSKYFPTDLVESWENIIAGNYEVVVINWQPARMDLPMDGMKALRAGGAKIILILQDTYEGLTIVAKDTAFEFADVLVAHEPIMMIGKEVSVIPVGIWMVGGLATEIKEPMIGIAGFPFPWKNFDVTAEAAKMLNVKCRMIAPKYEGVDTDGYVEGIRGHLGPLADIHREWLSNEAVVRMLSECTLNIFWYKSQSRADELGQSGSVRMGIAAKRPMIISRHHKMKTLFPYEDELYIADTLEEVYEMAKDILLKEDLGYNHLVKRPKRIIEEMGWDKTAVMWKKLIEQTVMVPA